MNRRRKSSRRATARHRPQGRRPDPAAAHPLGRCPFRARPNPAEALALDLRLFGDLRSPAAFALDFEIRGTDPDDQAHVVLDGGVGVLCLYGPIEHHSHWYWASYEGIAYQVECALADESVKVLCLKIDSPGGVAAGMGEAHKAIRRLAKKYGKRVYAYIDEQACSAAYHVASACYQIWLPEAAQAGSVGVILCTVDETQRLDDLGVKVRYVVTGKRKADLHPGAAVTDEVLAVAQEKVDQLGDQFFGAVAKARGLSREKVKGFEAAVFVGKEAVSAGLADGVMGWEHFLDLLRGPSARTVTDGSVSATTERATMNLKRKLAAAQRAMHTARDAFAAKQTPATKAAYLGALILALAAAKALGAADSTVSAKMKKVTERYSEKKERLEESDDEEEEEEEEASAATSADSESMSRSEKSSEEEEEEASPSTAKSEEEEEEEEERKGKRAKGGESEEEEEEEEEAVAKGWTAARRAYRKAAVGVDAYGLRGPKGLLAACEKALGVRGPSAVLGALAALPKRRKADDALAAQVVQLTTNARKQRVDAIVAKAKDEGRAPSKALRDSLRAAGAKNGTRWLAAHVATLPAIKRKRDQGADEHGNPINPPARSGQRADYQAGEVMGLGGLSDKDRELAQKIRGDIDNRKRANGAGRPVG